MGQLLILMNPFYSGLSPFLFDVSHNFDRIECDEDGWTLKVNDEPKTDSFLHVMSPSLINYVKIRGHSISISYVGFGGAGENDTNTSDLTFYLFGPKI